MYSDRDPAQPPKKKKIFPPLAKVKFCQKMALESWKDLADLFEITPQTVQGFPTGDEPRRLWELIETREQLHLLLPYLEQLDLAHVAEALRGTLEANGGNAGEDHSTLVLHPPPRHHRDLDTLFFDLVDARRILLRGPRNAQDPVSTYALPHTDPVVGLKILEWLPYCFDGIVCKPKISLGPLLNSVGSHVARLANFRGELEMSDIACHVDGIRAPQKTILSFLEQLADTFKDVPRRLVVILTVAPETTLPDEFALLPAPNFRPEDVAMWTGEILAKRVWPTRLSSAWAEMVCDCALEEDGSLDPARTYEVMEESINRLLYEPEAFRQDLEKWSSA